MKTLYISLLLCCFQLLVWGQKNPISVKNIVGQANAEQVSVTFTLGKGDFCSGATLYRTLDTLDATTHEKVGEIVGVCGAQDFEASYTLYDEAPYKNQPTFYRLLLGDIPTEYITITFYDYGKSGYTIYPNPATTHTTLYLENPKQDEAYIEIFNFNGRLVHTSPISRSTQISWNCANSPSGNYIFKLYKDEELIDAGVIVVQ